MNNLVLRSAEDRDLKAIHSLAQESGFGLTTLPKDRTLLAERLEQATASWQHIRHTPGNEYYLFVLEDTSSGDVVGTSAIEAATGVESPFYSYKLSKRIKSIRSLPNKNQDELLNLVNDHQGHSELCTLYLKPSYRREQTGAFLSRGRFLFMAQYPERFASTVIAEMRGITNTEGHSPFWDAIGYHFFNLSFIEADHLTLSTDKQFIADCMPEYPIYVKLLPLEAQAAIAKPHPSTVPAMNLLHQEGFFYNRYIDIFDAGPVLESPLERIRTLKQSQTYTLAITKNKLEGPRFLLANTHLNFRATIGQANLDHAQNTCQITEDTAHRLNLESGNALRVSSFD
jgi:arginine N-succinyltransferase